MRNDLDRTFGEIFNDDISALRAQLIDIQQHQADRQDSEKWVRRLRFLDVSRVPKLKTRHKQKNEHKAEQIIPITRRKDDDGDVQYIAVSWRWVGRNAVTPYGCETQTTFDYRIQRPGDEKPHKSDFPDWYMERVILFAQSINITNVWIDTECIYQRSHDPPNDKQLGVQIMDVVYGDSAASVGLLTTGIIHQDEVESLAAILDKSIFVDPKDKIHPKLKSDVDTQRLQLIILRVLSDPRWSRGWIFQEDHLASAVMTLLIPHAENIKKGHEYDFGDILGELQVNIAEFRQAVTMFCLACSEDEGRWPLSEILGKAKQYNIWNKRVYTAAPNPQDRHPVRLWSDSSNLHRGGEKLNAKKNYSNISFYPTTTSSVLHDICSRSLEKDQDRIAIVANALEFATRLDISDKSPLMTPNQYSLSATLLALIILNGEILSNGHQISENVLQHTLRFYLRAVEYKFHAPNFRFEQSFIDHCRFRSPRITDRGIQARGFLFELLPKPDVSSPNSDALLLKLDDQDRDNLFQLARDPHSHTIHKGQKLNAIAREAIEILIAKLETVWPNSRLADFLHHHLDLDKNRPRSSEIDASVPYVLDMMSAIYQALRDDCELRLARLTHEPNTVDPSALFIMPQPHGWGTEKDSHDTTTTLESEDFPTTIFTSWNQGRRTYERESLASLEVSIFDEHGRRGSWDAEAACFLRSYGWVNGVWDARGKHMSTYVFPLAGITDVTASNDVSRKRKRVAVEHAQ